MKKKIYIAFDRQQYVLQNIEKLLKTDAAIFDLAVEWVGQGYADVWCEDDFNNCLESGDPDLMWELKSEKFYKWRVVTTTDMGLYETLKK